MGRILKKMFSLDRMLGILFLIGAASLYIYDVNNPGPLEFVRNKVFDFYQQTKPREIPELAKKPVVIIDLDEESLREVGQWPWPRKTIAQLVENTFQLGAGLFAFDVVFAEPDRLNPSSVAKGMFNADEELIKKLSALPSNDEIFAKTIAKYPVVLGQAAYWNELPDTATPPKFKSVALLKQNKTDDPMNFIPQFRGLVRNVSVIEETAKGHGIFSILPEQDGVVRRVPTLFGYQGQLFPALSIEMLRVATGRKTIALRMNEAGVVKVGIHKAINTPTDRRGRIWPYFSRTDRAKYVSAKDILSGLADPALIQGKLAILGTSAVGLLDIRSVPTEKIIPGVEVHAQVIESILHQQFLSRPNVMDAVELALLTGMGLMMIILVPWVGAKWTMMLFLTFSGAAAYASWYVFAEHRMLMDATYPIACILLLYTMLTYTGYAREEKQRQQVRSAFGFYLSPDMVERLAEDPSQLALGGETRDMTLLFCDVRGFTTISEQFDAEGLTQLINKLLTPLTNVIMRNRGTVDKYMGDCIMAFWNAPLDDADHAKHGCKSALLMLAEMEPLNERLEKEALEEGRKHVPLKVGLGLNSGEAVVGNMGSDQRFDYSVLGDTVNLAARLEGQSKSYGVNIVIGDITYHQVKDEFATLELDQIKVKGKTEAVTIHCLLGDAELLANPDFQALKAEHDAMLVAYRAQNWDEATARSNAARAIGTNEPFALDGFYDLYDERISVFKADPPGADWDGVFVATTK